MKSKSTEGKSELSKLFTKSGFCKEYGNFEVPFREFYPNSETMVKRRKVKSCEKEITNFHDKVKGYLSDSQIKILLTASKKQDAQNENTLHTIRL